MFTCDMVNGFRLMDSHIVQRDFPSIEERFRQIFDTPYRHSTYYDARRRLKAMRQQDIDSSVTASHTVKGLWSRLAKNIPLKKT